MYLGKQKLVLAKPLDRFDQYNVTPLEHACMTFAASKGLRVASTTLYTHPKGTTLLIERFDREQIGTVFRRVPMLSGLTLLDTEWHVANREARLYARLADEMGRREVPKEDRRELYTRMIYNVLVGNADDHPRNHAINYKEGC